MTDSDRADAFDQSWGLDGLGNFSSFDDDGTSQSRTTNAANEITGITGTWIDPTYDDAGNMIAGPKTGEETTRLHHVYDAWNRQTAVYEDDGDGSFEPGTDDDLVAAYEYDGANRRIEKTFADDSGVEYFYNRDWQMLEERAVDDEGTPTAVNQYIWSARYIDSPVVRFHDANADGDLLDAGDNTRYYTGDANYNVTGTIDAATGDVVERYVYTAYGAATVYDEDWANPTAPATDGPLYAGYFFDAESALYQVRNRYYDSSLSIFISRDPIGYTGEESNLYCYAANGPLSHVDPNGLKVEICKMWNFTFAIIPFIPHYWIGTSSECVGLENYGWCCNTKQSDHSKFKGHCWECGSTRADACYFGGVELYWFWNCNESCVNNLLTPEGETVLSHWCPLVNDCRSFVIGVLDKCCETEHLENPVSSGYATF